MLLVIVSNCPGSILSNKSCADLDEYMIQGLILPMTIEFTAVTVGTSWKYCSQEFPVSSLHDFINNTMRSTARSTVSVLLLSCI